MDHLVLYCVIAAVFSHQTEGRPGWLSFLPFGHNNLHQGPTALPVVRHDGFLADTHEVAAAKQAHLAVLALADHDSHHHPAYDHHHITPYHGPTAIPVVLPSGHLADTPEVAVAKLHHLGALAKAKADKYYSGHSEHGYGGAYGYSGSYKGYGIPVILPNGHIADTHEVAAAKSAHLLAMAKAKADKYYTAFEDGYGYGGGYGYSGSYHGYGVPVVLPNGHLADTHEVAAAKSAHLAAVAHAKAEQAHSHYYDNEEYSGDGEQYGFHPQYIITYRPHHNTHYIDYNPHYIDPSTTHGNTWV